MRNLIVLSIIVILLKLIDSTGANWTERMTKYGGISRNKHIKRSEKVN